jgi:enterochelin esterase family protein
MHDGEDYVRYASLKTSLDNLIHRLEIPSLVVALTQSRDRLREYADDPRHADFLVRRPRAAAREQRSAGRKPSARCLSAARRSARCRALRRGLARTRAPSTAWAAVRLRSRSPTSATHDRGPLFDPVVRWVNDSARTPASRREQLYVSVRPCTSR